MSCKIGTAGVGKTQFINRLQGNRFNSCYKVTSQYDIRNLRYGDKDIEFYDFAGTLYNNTNNDLFIDLDVLLLMFDDINSYKRGKQIALKIIEKYSPKRVMVVQNKIDRMDSDALNSKAYKISVKSHSGIQELMHDLTMT